LDPQWLIEGFWKLVNDLSVVSANILTADAVQVHIIDGKQIIVITIPRAPLEQSPVFIGSDPYTGSYRRCGEGDYRIPREEIQALLEKKKR